MNVKNIEGGIIGSTQTTLRVVCRNSACAFCQKTNDCCEMAISNILVSVVHQKTVWKSVTDFGFGVRKCHEPCIDFAACFSFSDSGSWHCFAKCIRQVLVAIAPVPLPLNGQWWLYTHFAQQPHCINRACECTSTILHKPIAVNTCAFHSKFTSPGFVILPYPTIWHGITLP